MVLICIFLPSYNHKALNDLYGSFYVPTVSVFITGNEEDFYGYEDGILVPGMLFDKYKEDLVDSGEISVKEAEELIPKFDMDANFNHKDWVRKCSIEIVDHEGQKLFSDRIGIRISGNASRSLAQKSFVVMTGKEYGSKSRGFYIDFGKGKKEYSKLRIHSGGQDLRDTQIRDEVCSDIALRCGIDVVREEIPAMVWINSKYYGVAHIETLINEEYLANKYNLNKENVEIVNIGIKEALEVMGFDYGKEYDFSDEILRKKLEDTLDVDDFCKYIAFNVLLRNYDWPFNNFMAWHYTGNGDASNVYKDGRYRFIVSDVDVAFKNDVEDPFNMIDYGEIADDYLFIKSILDYKPYRDKFVNVLMDYVTVGLSEDYICDLVDNILAGYGEAFDFAYANTTIQDVKDYLRKHDENVASLNECMLKRRAEIYDHIYRYYNTGEGYIINIYPAKESVIKASTVKVYPESEEYSSLRSLDCQMELFVETIDGKPVKNAELLINGEKCIAEDGCFLISPEYAKNGIITVSMVE